MKHSPRFIRTIAICLLTTLMASSLTGCSVFRRPSAVASLPTEPITYHNASDLTDDQYYVMHEENEKKTFSKLYARSGTFDVNYQTETDSSRTLWYFDDFDAIPTLYEGDKLVFSTAYPFDEYFSFERFEYVGPTIGIMGINRMHSGKYYIDVSEDRMDTNCIPVGCDAYKLYNLNTSVAVINTLGKAPLKPGNITRGSLISGLKKDETYETEFYVGTKKYTTNLRADVIALTSMDDYTSRDYRYLNDGLVEIDIPSHFNTGYYAVNGKGLFRYVKGTAYDENTDFNVPNDVINEVETTSMYSDDITASPNVPQGERMKVKEPVLIDSDGAYEISVEFGEMNPDDVLEGSDPIFPTAKLVSDDGAFTLSKVEGENILSTIADLKAGKYTLEIDLLFGRDYYVDKKPIYTD